MSDRRRKQCGSLFRQIAGDESHVLRCLLPTKTDSHPTDRLPSATTYPLLYTCEQLVFKTHLSLSRLLIFNSYVPLSVALVD